MLPIVNSPFPTGAFSMGLRLIGVKPTGLVKKVAPSRPDEMQEAMVDGDWLISSCDEISRFMRGISAAVVPNILFSVA